MGASHVTVRRPETGCIISTLHEGISFGASRDFWKICRNVQYCVGRETWKSSSPRPAIFSALDYNRGVMATAILPTSIQPRTPQGGFRNEPFTDFKHPDEARAMRAALEEVAGLLGREYDLVIGGERLKTELAIQRRKPVRPAQFVGIHKKAG